MRDKDKLAPLLRAFELGKVDSDYTMDFILHIYSNSRRFNWNNFSLGVSIGALIMFIIIRLMS